MGAFAIAVMVISYACERLHRGFVAIFAAGCALSAFYALLIGSYPFLVAESVWSIIALHRWRLLGTGARR